MRTLRAAILQAPEAEEFIMKGAIDWLRSKPQVIARDGTLDPAKVQKVLDQNQGIISELPANVRQKLTDELQLSKDYQARMAELDKRETALKDAKLDGFLAQAIAPDSDPKQFLGLAARYSSLSAANAQNILSAGGSGSDNTSVYLVVWGDQTVYCHFPKGSKAGLIHEDLGEQTVYNSDGTRLQAYATRYQWKNGLVVKDWRYVVRICNIDVSDLIGQTGTQAASAATNIVKLMARSLYRIPNMAMGRAAFYMNRTVHSGLSIAALDKSQYVLKINEGLSQFGTPYSWLSFLGVPLRRVDAIINTEAVVS